MTVNIKPKIEPAKPGKQFADAEVTIEKGGEVIQSENEKMEVPLDTVSPNGVALDAEIEFGLTAIIPTGEYQNIRVTVGVKCKCEADTDVMDGTFGALKEWVDTKITDVVAEITSE